MNLIFVFHDLLANIKGWLRSPGTVFWTILFPILLILIFGAIFSTGDEIELDLVVQDHDESLISKEFVGTLKNISGLNVIVLDKEKDPREYMQDEDKPVLLAIPKGLNTTLIEYIETQHSLI